MRVLITGCQDDNDWYEKKIGEQYNVLDDVGLYFIDPTTENHIRKQDAHVIQPAWRVMKEAEETGRDVEYWNIGAKEWWANCGLFSAEYIYRLKPEPIAPKLLPLSNEELRFLLKSILVKKSDNSEWLVTAYKPDEGLLLIDNCWHNNESLLETFKKLNGDPLGKEAPQC